MLNHNIYSIHTTKAQDIVAMNTNTATQHWQEHATDSPTLVNVQQLVEEYLDRSDWRVNANANQGYSLGGLILNMAGNVTANYWLNHIYDPDIGSAHRDGDVHIHDLVFSSATRPAG